MHRDEYRDWLDARCAQDKEDAAQVGCLLFVAMVALAAVAYAFAANAL